MYIEFITEQVAAEVVAYTHRRKISHWVFTHIPSHWNTLVD